MPSEGDPLDARGERLLAGLAERSGVPIDFARSRIVAQGRAGGVAALEQAVHRLTRGEDEAILVGGVDSWFDADRLEALDAGRRLHGPGTENGFIPGEGAAFVLLVTRRKAGTDRRWGSLVAASTELEPRPFGSTEPCHALGISVALNRAMAPAAGTKVGWTLTDVLGERHRAEEWLFASGRIQSALTADVVQDTPLEVSGDVGAASALLLVVVACLGWQTGYAPARLALIAAHSDGLERGAALLAEETS
jgi:3-oxoacyl-[acyl-carrier-protein] synthase-1